MHSWGGGLERWVQDYCRDDTTRTNLVLKSIGTPGLPGQRLAFYQHIDEQEPTRFWDFTFPINSTCVTHDEYRYALEEIIKDFNVQGIIISSFIGHSLDILDTGLETIVICHDYYPFCPAINIYFNQVCTKCNFSHLQRCFNENKLNNYFPRTYASDWINIRKHFLDLVLHYQIPLVVPSSSVKHHLIELEPAFKEVNFIEINHGLKLKVNPLPINIKNFKTSKIKILILGRLTAHKGIDLLKEFYKEILDIADIYLLGCGEEGLFFEGIREIQIVAEKYDLVDLPNYVEKISPNLGLLLSVWPETFCYTLSELMVLGIPPLATKLGGFKDRIKDGINGFLVAPEKEALIQKIKELFQQRELLLKVAANLRSCSHKTQKEMINEYHKLIPLEIPYKYKPLRELNWKKMTHAELERLYVQVAQSQGQLQQLLEQLEFTRMELKFAQNRIAAMETSKFWKLRTQWFRIKKMLGMKIDE
jgi:glycosyltransferase involved in cell wall biosynthesis